MRVRLQLYLRKSRHEIYYFRRAIPAAIVDHFATRELYVSLKTGDRGEAEYRALPLYLKSERVFEAVKRMTKKPQVEPEVGATVELVTRIELFDKDGKLSAKLALDHTPEEAEAVADLVLKLVKGIGQLEGLPRLQFRLT